MKPQVFLFPLQVAAMQGRYVAAEEGSRRLEVTLPDGAVLVVESFGHASGWDALATLRREGTEVAVGGHAGQADRFLAEAHALALLAVCCEVQRLPVMLRRALASEYREVRGRRAQLPRTP